MSTEVELPGMYGMPELDAAEPDVGCFFPYTTARHDGSDRVPTGAARPLWPRAYIWGERERRGEWVPTSEGMGMGRERV